MIFYSLKIVPWPGIFVYVSKTLNMIRTITIALLFLTGVRCHSPAPITGSPDKLTTTTGTAGSAKMSNELPGKTKGGNPTDTDKIKGPVKIDSLRPRKDTARLWSCVG